MKIPKYLEQLIDSVPNNSTLRFICPNCSGNNSLGITKAFGKVKWNCFKCLKYGVQNYQRNVSELKSQLEARREAKGEFRLPEYLIYGLSSENSVSLITRGHCLEPYRQGLFDIGFDPEQNRVCFIVKKDNKIVGLIGRAVDKSIYPKTLNYPNSDLSMPFICNNTDTLVLVEDCLSAASVTRIPELTGLALLGGTLKVEYIPIVKKYKKIIIALDRDARKKALAIKRKLVYYHDSVKIWHLENDIKDTSNEDIIKLYNSFKG